MWSSGKLFLQNIIINNNINKMLEFSDVVHSNHISSAV